MTQLYHQIAEPVLITRRPPPLRTPDTAPASPAGHIRSSRTRPAPATRVAPAAPSKSAAPPSPAPPPSPASAPTGGRPAPTRRPPPPPSRTANAGRRTRRDTRSSPV